MVGPEIARFRRQGSQNLQCSGSGKGVFLKRGLLEKGSFQKSPFLFLENLEMLEILENPQTLENKGKSDHFLDILENLENLEILEIPPVKRPLSK